VSPSDPSEAAPGGRHNLPADLTRFIGREAETAEVRRLLPGTRLLTLAGSAGVGKTRLALRVAADVAGQYRDGVRLVELAALADPLLVPRAVADALGVPEQPGRGLRDTLADALRPRHLLLVLDNCEHLVQACAELVAALLRACPDLRVLATSRQSLHVDGETVWRVPSMTLPPPDRPSSEVVVAYHDATRLFVERATAALPSFVVSERNAAAIVRICTRLDGIPLAIELAAARVPVLGVEGIEVHLSDRFRLLGEGSRVALPRQQTLRATIDWSFGLLSVPERALFRRLAVFAGGWMLEAAEAVGAGEGLTNGEVLGPLAELVDKSLVVADETGGSVRYRLLETMREYGWEKLRAAGEEAIVRDRHGAWFLALAEGADDKIRGPEQAAWLSRLEREHDNLRAALAWCLADERDADAALRLAGSLAWFWRLRGYMGEGRRWLERALAQSREPATGARVHALNGAGFLAFAQNDMSAATALFTEGLRLARDQDDLPAAAWALHGLGRAAWGMHDWARAKAVLEESLAGFRGSADIAGSAYSLYFLGSVARDCEDYARAAALYADALTLAREAGDTWSIAWVLIHWGDLASRQGDVEQAAGFYREALLLSDKIGALWGVSSCLWGLARVAAAQGQWARAARLFGADQVLMALMGTDHGPLESADWRGVIACRVALGTPRFEALAAEGRAMTRDEAIAHAMGASERTARPAPGAPAGPPSPPGTPLTPREREVAVLIARGLSNREIAQALVITRRTADTHVMNILTKLELHARAQVAAWAVEHGLITAADRG
jgi:non-specific serine/threonine protein kinase